MKLLIFFFVISVTLKNLECYDMEIEGTVKLSKKFMKEVKRLRAGESISDHEDDEPMRKRIRKNFQSDNDTIIVNKQKTDMDENKNTFKDDNKETESNVNKKTIREHLTDFAAKLSSIGIEELQNITNYLRGRCGIVTDLRIITKPALADYAITVKNKTKDLIKSKYQKKTLTLYELEYMLLNIVEISSSVFYRKLKMILDDMLKSTTKTSVELDAKALSEMIYTRYVNYKRRGISRMCNIFHRCRQFPGFSDYFADLISEIHKLPKTKLLSILEITKKLLLQKLAFIVEMLDTDVFRGIVNKLKESNDVPKVRQTLALMRSVITARYKLLYTNHASNHELVKRTKAVRVLLDIFDKTFYMDGEDLISINFDTLVSVIRQWAMDKRNNESLSQALNSFLQYILNTIKHVWTDGSVNEINVLIEVILLGYSSDEFSESFLLSKGSHFVRNPIDSADTDVAFL